jgi:hypothetical protein
MVVFQEHLKYYLARIILVLRVMGNLKIKKEVRTSANCPQINTTADWPGTGFAVVEE